MTAPIPAHASRRPVPPGVPPDDPPERAEPPLVVSLFDRHRESATDRDEVVPDALSFEDFYLSTRVELGRAIALALGDRDLAAEATDEAFTRACARWRSIRDGNPSGWVYRVALNWALSVLRQRRRSLHQLYEPSVDHVADSEPAVHAALAELDPKHRAVVVCRHLLGWSVADTAAALRIREGTVKSRLSRANRVLAARLRHLRPDQEQP